MNHEQTVYKPIAKHIKFEKIFYKKIWISYPLLNMKVGTFLNFLNIFSANKVYNLVI